VRYSFPGDYATVEAFMAAHRCVCEFFQPTDAQDYIGETVEGLFWIDYMKAHPARICKVRIAGKGREYRFLLSFSVVESGGGEMNMVAFHDITELETYRQGLESRVAEEVAKQREQEYMLIQQSKMAAMGEMLGAIAHNWRQPLNVVALIAQDLLDAYKAGEMDEPYMERSVETLMKHVRFMSQTINDFRTFFQPETEENIFELEECVRKTFDLLDAQLADHSIQFQCDCGKELMIRGTRNQFQQALVNLVLNAKDAIDDSLEEGACGQISVKGEPAAGAMVLLTLRDNGGGASGETLERMFEPYFTTKEQGKGTGIGLYMAKMILERNMGGTVTAQNWNDGLEVAIKLPRKL